MQYAQLNRIPHFSEYVFNEFLINAVVKYIIKITFKISIAFTREKITYRVKQFWHN
jgi:hypothetical protein